MALTLLVAAGVTLGVFAISAVRCDLPRAHHRDEVEPAAEDKLAWVQAIDLRVWLDLVNCACVKVEPHVSALLGHGDAALEPRSPACPGRGGVGGCGGRCCATLRRAAARLFLLSSEWLFRLLCAGSTVELMPAEGPWHMAPREVRGSGWRLRCCLGPLLKTPTRSR
eukprot:CAMPEP_0175231258 /NCGR_PEP_ID=MMETSP0093-20121207/25365_1 /TAXON_ID=311494 /ORGANISM="Alexandrium monilatum, Strain CCMP3105" /LENGTH=166 /DNA_ID=CAMNT_0016525107 /DNA_START=85 /DNA_END=583 /DNA_ORIENTATION=-